jgi:hypothetical protein
VTAPVGGPLGRPYFDQSRTGQNLDPSEEKGEQSSTAGGRVNRQGNSRGYRLLQHPNPGSELTGTRLVGRTAAMTKSAPLLLLPLLLASTSLPYSSSFALSTHPRIHMRKTAASPALAPRLARRGGARGMCASAEVVLQTMGEALPAVDAAAGMVVCDPRAPQLTPDHRTPGI